MVRHVVKRDEPVEAAPGGTYQVGAEVRGLKRARILFMRNTASVTTITFGWSTGSTVSLLTGTSAVITADGNNAIKLMTGT